MKQMGVWLTLMGVSLIVVVLLVGSTVGALRIETGITQASSPAYVWMPPLPGSSVVTNSSRIDSCPSDSLVILQKPYFNQSSGDWGTNQSAHVATSAACRQAEFDSGFSVVESFAFTSGFWGDHVLRTLWSQNWWFKLTTVANNSLLPQDATGGVTLQIVLNIDDVTTNESAVGCGFSCGEISGGGIFSYSAEGNTTHLITRNGSMSLATFTPFVLTKSDKYLVTIDWNFDMSGLALGLGSSVTLNAGFGAGPHSSELKEIFVTR
jgi:hypothetical protein